MKNKTNSLKKNILYLGFVQGVNFLFPLFLIPYFTGVLGVSGYGQIAFVQVLCGYAYVFIEYGLVLSATRRVSINALNRSKYSEVVCSVWGVQVFIYLIFLIIGLFSLVIFNVSNLWLYFLGFLSILGLIFSPQWFFQGLELNKQYAFIQISGKILSLPVIFLVKKEEDVLVAMTALLLNNFFSATICIVYIKVNKLLIFQAPKLKTVFKEIKHGKELFFSKIIISSYTNLTPIIVGYVCGAAELALYSLADKVKGAALSLLYPISQAVFSRASFYYEKNDSKNFILLIKKSTLAAVFSGGGICFLMYNFSDVIVYKMGGKEFNGAVDILKVMSFLPLIIALSSVVGLQVLMASGMNKEFNRAISLGGVVNFLLIIPCVISFNSLGASYVCVVTEVVILILMCMYVVFSFDVEKGDSRGI